MADSPITVTPGHDQYRLSSQQWTIYKILRAADNPLSKSQIDTRMANYDDPYGYEMASPPAIVALEEQAIVEECDMGGFRAIPPEHRITKFLLTDKTTKYGR